MSELIWYAAYGSNLCYGRFMCYIAGGTPEGSRRHQRGCSDRSPPRQTLPLELPHRLRFAEYDGHAGKEHAGDVWGGGGAAFIDPSPAAGATTYGRKYLITMAQLAEVVAQENDRPVDELEIDTPNGRLPLERLGEAPRLDQTSPPLRLVTTTGAPPAYNLIVGADPQSEDPVLTFTGEPVAGHRPARPSEAYLRTIVRGLVETCPGHDDEQLVSYLRQATEENWKREDLLPLIEAGRDGRLIVTPTYDRSGAVRSFIAQISWDDRPKEVGFGDEVIVSRDHGQRTIRTGARLHRPASGQSLPERGTIRMDQKLRVALGVSVGQLVTVEAPHRSGRGAWRRLLQWLGGVQPQLVRATHSRYEDMEISVCRLPASTFDVIGVESGDYVWIESTSHRTRRRVLNATPEILAEHTRRMGNPDAAVPDCTELLDLAALDLPRSDLPPLFIDADARQVLGIDACDPVYVYRDVSRLLAKQLQYLSFTLAIGAMILLLERPEWLGGWWIPALVVLTVLSTWLIFLQIRKTIS